MSVMEDYTKELEGKRRLVLGGNPWAKVIKQFADNNGV